MRKKLLTALLGVVTGAILLAGSGGKAFAAAQTDSVYISEGSTENSNSTNSSSNVDELVAAGEFDSTQLTSSQLKYIEEEYGEDPQAITELQKQSDYNKSPALYSNFGTFTHDEQFDGYDVVNGIDVSNWNGTIDWEKVKESGIDFAIIRVALRYYGSGKLDTDDNYKANLEGAIAAGLDVGVYIYSQATTIAEAKEEARYTLNLIKGYNINLPIVMDFEYAGNNIGRLANAHLSVAQATKICNAFCAEVEKKNYTPMVYANKSLLTNDVNAAAIANKYPIWLAQYPGYSSVTHTIQATYKGKYSYWQYSSSGSVPGISGNVDMNLRYIKKPKTVKNLKRSDATMKTITLSWDKVPYVYGYKIYRLNKETGEYEYLAAVRGSGHTSYTDKNVKVNTMYSYKVCAYYKLANGNYTGNFSDVLNALPDQKPIENISFSKATDTSLKISWDKETEVTGYRITRYNSKTGKYETVATIKSADTTSYTDTGLASGTTYKYKVRAYYEEDGVRAYFNNSDSKSHSTLPGVITGITATKNTNNSVTLTWNKQDIVTGYRLYMLDSATGTWNKIATIKDSGTNTYTVTGLKSNKKYEFSLIAYYTVNKKSGTTKRSDTYTTYTAPAEVKGITGTPVSNKKVKISWTPAKNVTGYYVYLKDTATNKWTKVATIDDKNVDSYTHSGLKANTSYSFRVKAYRKVNNATYTGTAVSVDVSTKTSAVKNVSIRKHGTKYMLTWNTQKSASGYYIYKYNPKTKKYTRLAKIKGASNNIYIVSKAQSSKCKYVIASYVTYNGKNYKGAYSEYADTVKKSASCTVAGNLINIRSGAGTKYAVTTTVKKGTNLKITNVTYSGNTSWYKVTFTQNGKTVTGYILSDYVDITFK